MKTINMDSNSVALHGEVMIFPSTLSKNAKKLKIKGNRFVIAESEVTGNDHFLDIIDGIDIYEDEGKIKMVNSVNANIKCVINQRHSEFVFTPNTYEFGTQQEYDPFLARMQNVRD